MIGVFLGLDIGTSGVRAAALDQEGQPRGEVRVDLPPPQRDGEAVGQDPVLWWTACRQALGALAAQLAQVGLEPLALAVDGTSGTLLAIDAWGDPLGQALMYNDRRCRAEAARVALAAPADSAALGPSAALAKALWLRYRHPDLHRLIHQSEWITGKLLGDYRWGDENNCLKLGYDPVSRSWPAWIGGLGVQVTSLPQVVPPGTRLGSIHPELAAELGLPPGLQIHAGTTDSTASFLATGASEMGEGVTALGSTLVVKVLSDRPINAPEYGIYSHPLGDLWLAGGGSNSGGAVLLEHFTRDQLQALTPRMDPNQPTGLDYYPLRDAGERFPISDPDLPPRLLPRPGDPARFLQGMLEGMAEIERRGYALLEQLGGPPLRSVRTTGGGAANGVWSAIRARSLGVPLLASCFSEAAYGAAMLARGPK